MKAIAISDDDSLVGHIDSAEVDVLLSLADVWDTTIEKAIARYRPKKVFAVRGNHDSDGPLPAGVPSLHLRVESFHHGHQHTRETTQRGETQIVGVFGESVLEIAKNSKPED